jgi:hypothetical protein
LKISWLCYIDLLLSILFCSICPSIFHQHHHSLDYWCLVSILAFSCPSILYWLCCYLPFHIKVGIIVWMKSVLRNKLLVLDQACIGVVN